MLEVDVEVPRGTFSLRARLTSAAPIVALFGRSGSGKTTLVETIAGLVRPSRGRIAVDGRVLFDSSRGIDLPARRRRVGYVFQEALLFPHLSVARNLDYGARSLPPGEQAIQRTRVVELLGLERLLERRPATLSGGERQRVAIGRALLAAPRLLLMDEPLASLDAARKAEILAYVELLRDELRLPIVYVSHAFEEVTRLADHLVLMAGGETVAEGSIEEIMARSDLRPHTGRFEAGAVLAARVASHDERYGLTRLEFDGGSLVVPNLDALPGAKVRVRIRARDVAIALDAPSRASFRNVIEATVDSVGPDLGALVEVGLRVGAASLKARITRQAAEELGIAPGMAVHALVKAVSIDRHSVGFA